MNSRQMVAADVRRRTLLGTTPKPPSHVAGYEDYGTRLTSNQIAQLSSLASRWLLLGAVVYAPWAYGCTTTFTARILTMLLLGLGGLRLLSWGLQRTSPALPLPLAILTFALLVMGWWTTFAQNRSAWDMLLITGLLGASIVIADAGRDRQWRNRFALAMAGTGASIALFGILQKLGGEQVLAWVWEPAKRNVANNFGMFRYRANAGAFLNIVLAVAACSALAVWRKGASPLMKTTWATILLTLLLGVALNPSRASWCIALAIIGCIVALAVLRHGLVTDRSFWIYTALLTCGLAVAASTISFGKWQTAWKRLQSGDLALHERCPYPILWTAAKDAGGFGFGAGQFHKIFPEYQKNFVPGEEGIPSFWMLHYWPHAHQDYLQTIIEWGWCGAALWVCYFLGAGACAVRTMKHRESLTANWLLTGTILAVGAILLHGMVDFPMQIASIQLYIAVLVGLCWAARTGKSAGVTRPR